MRRISKLGLLLIAATAAGCLYPELNTGVGAGGADAAGGNTDAGSGVARADGAAAGAGGAASGGRGGSSSDAGVPDAPSAQPDAFGGAASGGTTSSSGRGGGGGTGVPDAAGGRPDVPVAGSGGSAGGIGGQIGGSGAGGKTASGGMGGQIGGAGAGGATASGGMGGQIGGTGAGGTTVTATCIGTTCAVTCANGYHPCGTTCAANDDANACGTSCTKCSGDVNGTAICANAACSLTCNTNYHVCSGQCVRNDVVATCGQTSCTPCQAPSGGSVSCNGVACVPACPTGKQLCAGTCIDASAACSGVCPAGSHNCSGMCQLNTSVDFCGTSCSGSCPAPTAHGFATCNGTSCGVTCDSQYRLCPGTTVCAANTGGCCTAADCTAGGTGTLPTCSANACSYPCSTPTYKQCGSSCILATTCCSPCTGGFTCRSGTCPITCTSDADCASDHFCRNGSCIGSVVSVYAGFSDACSIHSDGVVRCWGDDDSGQIVVGQTSKPTVITVPTVTSLVLGNRVSCAILADAAKTLWCWGSVITGANQFTMVAPGPYAGLSNVVSVSIGLDGGTGGGCAVLGTGAVWCWGDSSTPILGNGTVSSTSLYVPPQAVPGLNNAVEVSHSGGSVCARLSTGAVACWGENSFGQIGVGTYDALTSTVTPAQVLSPTSLSALVGVKMIDAGWCASFAILGGSQDGVLMGWGNADYLGVGQEPPYVYTAPVHIGGTTLFKTVNGRSSTCGITTTGTVKCWGFNYNGQVGPNGSGTFVLAPVDVPGIQNAISVACGWDACYAATGGTQIMAWGANNLGQLGNGTTGTGGPTPVSVVW